MTLDEACELWLRKCFSNIPIELIKKAYADCWEEFELLTSEEPTLDYPCGWGYLFMPDDPTDERWILNNLDIVQSCGFLVYYSKECSVLLAIDGAGYSFYEEHWLPLYKKRGLRWHKTE